MWLVIIHFIKHLKNKFCVVFKLYGVADVPVYMIHYSERIIFIDEINNSMLAEESYIHQRHFKFLITTIQSSRQLHGRV